MRPTNLLAAAVLVAAAAVNPGRLVVAGPTTIKWIETDGIKFCGGGTQWAGCPVDPFGTDWHRPAGGARLPERSQLLVGSKGHRRVRDALRPFGRLPGLHVVPRE